MKLIQITNIKLIFFLLLTFSTYIYASNDFVEIGVAGEYPKDFHLKPTASGESYNMYALTAGHRKLPFNSIVKITNLKNNLSLSVRINDRLSNDNKEDIQLSYQATRQLKIPANHLTAVKIELLYTQSSIKAPKSTQPIALEIAPKIAPKVTKESNQTNETLYYKVQVASFYDEKNALEFQTTHHLESDKISIIKREIVEEKRTIYKIIMEFKSLEKAQNLVNSNKFAGAYLYPN